MNNTRRMKKSTCLALICLMSMQIVYSQNSDSSKTQLPNGYPKLSVHFGYGKHGANARLDIQLAQRYFNTTSTLFYLELGGKSVTFSNPNFIFNNITYPSDSRVMSLAGGIAQEVAFSKRFRIIPYLGLRAEFVRFKSPSLVNAIGANGIQRNWGGTPVGPVVENAYGDATTVDIGSRVSVQLAKRLDLTFSVGYAPIRFDVGSTLFGQYWAQAPYENPYWVRRDRIRSELALRFIVKR